MLHRLHRTASPSCSRGASHSACQTRGRPKCGPNCCNRRDRARIASCTSSCKSWNSGMNSSAISTVQHMGEICSCEHMRSRAYFHIRSVSRASGSARFSGTRASFPRGPRVGHRPHGLPGFDRHGRQEFSDSDLPCRPPVPRAPKPLHISTTWLTYNSSGVQKFPRLPAPRRETVRFPLCCELTGRWDTRPVSQVDWLRRQRRRRLTGEGIGT